MDANRQGDGYCGLCGTRFVNFHSCTKETIPQPGVPAPGSFAAEVLELREMLESERTAVNNLTEMVEEITGEKNRLLLQYSEVMEAASDLIYPKRTDSAEPYMLLKRLVNEYRATSEKRVEGA